MSVECRFNVGLMSVYRILKFNYSAENKTFTNKTMSDVSRFAENGQLLQLLSSVISIETVLAITISRIFER